MYIRVRTMMVTGDTSTFSNNTAMIRKLIIISEPNMTKEKVSTANKNDFSSRICLPFSRASFLSLPAREEQNPEE